MAKPKGGRLAGAARPAQVDKRDGGVTLVHVRAVRLPFAPMSVRSGRACRVAPSDGVRSGGRAG